MQTLRLVGVLGAETRSEQDRRNITVKLNNKTKQFLPCTNCLVLFHHEADSYAYEKLIRKWTKSVFFGFFRSYGYENGPDSYGQIRLSFS